MSGKGVKRASPGADEEKNPLGDVELSDEDAKKLGDIQRSLQRVEIALERAAMKALAPKYEERRVVVKAIPKFWPTALMNHDLFSIHVQHHADQAALAYLEDVWIERDLVESRAFTIEFHFKENPYFSNAVLKKEYKYIPPPNADDETPDEDGLTESAVEFSWERDVEPQAFKINWKDPAKTLTKLYPRVADAEDDMPADSGSFFHFFETAEDAFDVGVVIGNEIFPEAIEYFLGTKSGDGDSEDEDDEEEDDDDDDADEIDLEKPRVKRAKH